MTEGKASIVRSRLRAAVIEVDKLKIITTVYTRSYSTIILCIIYSHQANLYKYDSIEQSSSIPADNITHGTDIDILELKSTLLQPVTT